LELTTLILQIFLSIAVVLVLGVTIGFLVTRTPRVTSVPEEPPITRTPRVTSVPEIREPESPGAEPQFEIYKDGVGKFRFRLKAPNMEIIAVGEAYESKGGCKKGIESIKKNAPIANVIDLTNQAT
jgi:uncharacterized protein YegP (UPF0339 family)